MVHMKFMTWLKCQDILWRAAGWISYGELLGGPYFHNESVGRNQAIRAVWESIPVGPTTRIMYSAQELLPTHPILTNFGALNWCTELACCPSFSVLPQCWWWSQAAGICRQLMVLCCHQVGMHEEILQLRPPGRPQIWFCVLQRAYITE